MSAPPFRAEHIGSLLRPAEVLETRAAFDDGRCSAADLRAVEDRHIEDAVRLQERLGLQPITDGEYRRTYYFGNFPEAVEGFTWMPSRDTFTGADRARMAYRTPVVTGRLRRVRGIATDDFSFVRALTERTPKVTMPSPPSQHYFRWREGTSDQGVGGSPPLKQAYDLDEFFADIVRIYREELAELAALGATYVQLDDVTFGMLSDPTHRAAFEARGYRIPTMLERYVRLVNDAVAGRPPGLAVGLHICRGNNQGRWLAEGGYDEVAEQVFGGLDLDALFLEYDSERAGGLEPLRFVGEGRHVVLGLVSTKTPELEDGDELRRRLDEAARFVPLDRLSLSPQCGFASTSPGNPLTPGDQEAKLRLVVETAARVWG